MSAMQAADDGKIEPLMQSVGTYLDKRLANVEPRPEPKGRRTG